MDKLLVANRSEIACRIFQTAKELGLKTVALLGPGDEGARHITYAEEVLPVEGYLNSQEIVEKSLRAGVKFIHPGYGFLSEKPEFARAVESAGISFLGPKAETMELLGGKIAAKELAARENVPTLPWAKVSDAHSARAAAQKIGFPLLIKASAGGGGKGMRRVDREEDLESAAESASAEVGAAFGDRSLFLERLLEAPRHIEVQVFGDGRGEGVHLHERECSLQRRHQKIWEEAPGPHLRPETRKGLEESALRLVRATSYRSAGTVEFLVDDAGGFYFLEMNTRLQVEHPVTEQITGLDLVAEQILLGINPKRKLFETPVARGYSIEVRIYAEDPARGFMPTPGVVRELKWPSGPGIRVDSGIEIGQEVHTQYDSMLAKLIVTAQTREHALSRLRWALSETVVFGLGSNLSYLQALCDRPEVIEGKVDTGYLDKIMNPFEDSLDEFQLAAIESLAQKWGGGDNRVSGGSNNWPSPWALQGRS